MKVAIVGSRRHPNKQQIVDYVNSLPIDTVVVSGGAEGVDLGVEEIAKARGMQYEIHYPDKSSWSSLSYYEMCERYYERNKKIVENSDKIVAFIMEDMRGGTMSTVKWAKKLKKPYELIYPERP